MNDNQHTSADNSAPRQRLLTGRVVSDRMDKTIVVLVERRIQHELYGKYIRRSSRFKAHDPDNTCRVGDIVEIGEGRPVSRNKAWALTRVLDSAGEFGTAG